MPLKKITKKVEKTTYKVLNAFYKGNNLISLKNEIDIDPEHIKLTYVDIDGKHDIAFEMSELPFCCGVLEIGELTISKTFPLIAFKQIMSEIITAINNKTVIINTNGKNDCIFWENHLDNCDELFTLVKTFKNTSGNIIKIWMSNNQ